MEDCNIDGRGWWICGPADYTLDVLPARAPAAKGFVYGLLLRGGNVKIGRTAQPRRRIGLFRSTIRTYGANDVVTIGLSHPTAAYKAIEGRLHDHFAAWQVSGELYSCSLADVASAIAGLGLIVPKLSASKCGRKNKPWYWAYRGAWFTTMGGKRIRLGDDQATAQARLDAILGVNAWQGGPNGTTPGGAVVAQVAGPVLLHDPA